MPAFTVVPDKASGSVFSEENWDSHIKDNLNAGAVRAIGHAELLSNAAQIDFSSIPADYEHLMLVFGGRTTGAVLASAANLNFNGVTSAQYDTQSVFGTGTVAGANEDLAATQLHVGTVPGNSGTGSNRFSACMAVIPHYKGTTHHKNVVSMWSYTIGTDVGSDGEVGLRFGHWRNASAISAITLSPGSGNWMAGTIATLYGMGYL